MKNFRKRIKNIKFVVKDEMDSPPYLTFDFDEAKNLYEWVEYNAKLKKLVITPSDKSVYFDSNFSSNRDYMKEFLTNEEKEYLKANPTALDDYYFRTLGDYLVKNQAQCLEAYKAEYLHNLVVKKTVIQKIKSKLTRRKKAMKDEQTRS